MFVNSSTTKRHNMIEMIFGRLSFEELFGNKSLKNSDSSQRLTTGRHTRPESSANRNNRPGDMFRDYKGLRILELERQHVQRLLDLGP